MGKHFTSEFYNHTMSHMHYPLFHQLDFHFNPLNSD